MFSSPPVFIRKKCTKCFEATPVWMSLLSSWKTSTVGLEIQFVTHLAKFYSIHPYKNNFLSMNYSHVVHVYVTFIMFSIAFHFYILIIFILLLCIFVMHLFSTFFHGHRFYNNIAAFALMLVLR